jgi:hypothetical protein
MGRRSSHAAAEAPPAALTLTKLLRWLLRLLSLLLATIVVRTYLKEKCGRRPEPRPKRPKSPSDCQPVPSTIYRRPDPLIYDQYYLMGLGLPVTWDNPDIHIERGGVTVDPHALEPKTEYDVVARVWNGSTQAPAVQLPVRFSFLTFGVGTTSTDIGTATVDLGVKGSAMCPAFARQLWTTPDGPGHYCVQAFLDWADDANPLNNLGQTNTDVRPLNSPRAAFAFPVHNGGRRIQRVKLRADGYTLRPPGPCDEPPAQSADMPAEERDRRMRSALAQHAGQAGLPDGWEVRTEPSEFALESGESTEVVVEATAPEGFEGRVAFNVNAFDGAVLLGGATLYVEGKANERRGRGR